MDWTRGLDGGSVPSRAHALESSVGEDRAILLGFSMMAFSVLMLFVVAVTTVRPYLSRYCRAPVWAGFILEGSGMSPEGGRSWMDLSGWERHRAPVTCRVSGPVLVAFSVLNREGGCRSEALLLSCSDWAEAGCVVLRTEILQEWVDCRGVSTVPCLKVTVNLTGSNQTALLHLDEELVLRAMEVQIKGTQIHMLDLKRHTL